MTMPICAGLVQLGLDLGKATIDNTAGSLGTLQGMLEDRLTDAVKAVSWMPGPVAGMLDEYVGLARRTRADMTATLDRCYTLLSQLVGSEP
jgi:hypothetical protein